MDWQREAWLPRTGRCSTLCAMAITFNAIRDGYLDHLALADATARVVALRERGPFKPTLVETLKPGPGYIMVFADMLERSLKLLPRMLPHVRL